MVLHGKIFSPGENDPISSIYDASFLRLPNNVNFVMGIRLPQTGTSITLVHYAFAFHPFASLWVLFDCAFTSFLKIGRFH